MNYEKMSLKELKVFARERKVKDRTKMNRNELIKALKTADLHKESKPQVKKQSDIEDGSLPEINLPTSITSKSGLVQKPVSEQKKEEFPIPENYNIDSLVLLPIDPSLQYSYWQISTNTRWQYKEYLIKSYYKYKLKFFTKDEEGTREVQEIEIGDYGNYYFHHYLPGKIAWIEAGFISDDGVFIPIMSSKRIVIPRDTLSNVTDETFMTVQENYMEILRLSGIDSDVHPGSIEFHKGLLKQLLKNINSRDLLSRGKE